MHKIISAFLVLSLLCCSSHLCAENDLDQYKEETEALWRNGTGAEDGLFSAISVSMLGWGIGLAAVFAVVASVLHQSTASTAHASAHSCP